MSELLFKKRMTKGAFEDRIVELFGREGLSAHPYVEEAYGGPPTRMTLYYANGVHIGTWQGGQGWVFKR